MASRQTALEIRERQRHAAREWQRLGRLDDWYVLNSERHIIHIGWVYWDTPVEHLSARWWGPVEVFLRSLVVAALPLVASKERVRP